MMEVHEVDALTARLEAAEAELAELRGAQAEHAEKAIFNMAMGRLGEIKGPTLWLLRHQLRGLFTYRVSR